MKMVQSSMIALACLLAGADAFGSVPGHTQPPDHAHCDGHTGDLALLKLVGSSCDAFDCNMPDGSDRFIDLGHPGANFALKDVCPETCGNPCAHAPTEDLVASSMMGFLTMDCPGAKAAGLCESDMQTNWFCGESCRSGAQWDECSFAAPGSVFMSQITADAQAERYCVGYEGEPGDFPYGESDCIDTPAADGSPAVDCTADSIADCVTKNEGYIDRTGDGTCPSDPSGVDCWADQTLLDYGSTQVNQCPGVRRRKLTAGTHSGAMMTKGVFTLAASGSK